MRSIADLGCASLVVAGSFAVGNGTVDQALDVTISLGGNLDGGNGTLNITGNWDNSAGGTFNAGTGSVNLVDGCGQTSASIASNDAFSVLTMSTSTGKTFRVDHTSGLVVVTQLSISGTAGNVLVLRSTSPGVQATLNVGLTTDVDFVDVQDIKFASGVILGPNSVIGSNVEEVELCGDIDGGFEIDASDVTMARDHLMGRAIAGNITLCNVIGPFDPLEGGAGGGQPELCGD